jgi:hypothetical protein
MSAIRNCLSFLVSFLTVLSATIACSTNGVPLASGGKTPLKEWVNPGTPRDARRYYEETLGELELKNWTEPLPKDDTHALESLSELQKIEMALRFLGYEDLTPEKFEDNLENVSSSELMRRYPNDLLASAFFAPKITDVSQSVAGINVGWRKIVYLKARPESKASLKGIEYAFLLFNKFQGPQHNQDPFEPRSDKSNESQTTQMMFLRAQGAKLQHRAYFLVYGPLSKGGKLKAALDASFDARAPGFEAIQPYYVPHSCGQCHGALRSGTHYERNRVQLNFLDTDHWFDRVQPGDDFAFLAQTDFGVLYDAGKERQTEKFKEAFDVIRRMNVEIRKQNESLGDENSLQLRASRKWLELHEKESDHKPVFQRVLGSSAWRADTTPDAQLLPLLNRFCYRCHSSVKFSLFDRSRVVELKNAARSYVSEAYMPQDRRLTEKQKQELLSLIESLSEVP